MNLKTTDQVKNMVSHIKTITKSAYYHLKSIARTKGHVVKKDSENLTHVFFSRLDYCNSLEFLLILIKKNINQLQFIQNAATRVLANSRKILFFTNFEIVALA